MPDQPDNKAGGREVDSHSEAIEACAKDLIVAIHAHDTKGAAEALKSAFEILDSMPHTEGTHIEPHSYDSQNQKAAKND